MYRELRSFAYEYTGHTKNQFLGRKTNRRCLFCLQEDPRAFRSRAHIVPEALGNRGLMTNEECDRCNTIASDLEGNLVSMLTGIRTISRMRTRTGSVQYGESGYDSNISAQAGSDRIHIHLKDGENLIRVDRKEKEKEFSISIRIPPFNMVKVGKVLARIGMLIASEDERSELEYILKWINGQTKFPSFIFHRLIIPGGGMTATTLGIYKWEGNVGDSAPYLLLVSFGYIALIFHFPNSEGLVCNYQFPSIRLPDGTILTEAERIPCEDRLTSGGWERYEFSYDTYNEIRPSQDSRTIEFRFSS